MKLIEYHTNIFFCIIQSNLSNKSALPVIRDKKSAGNSYSAAGDDDINDVAAMGGVNLQEEANVRFPSEFLSNKRWNKIAQNCKYLLIPFHVLYQK